MSKQLPQAIRKHPALKPPTVKLLSVNADAKTSKGLDTAGTFTAILYMAPSTEADQNNPNREGRKHRDLCPHASPGCKAGCLYRAGRAEFMPSIPAARIRKTLNYFDNKDLFLLQLRADLAVLDAWASATGYEVVVRLDGTTDIHLAKRFARLFPNLQFYDYTKDLKYLLANKISNLHLTFSRSEINEHECKVALAAGFGVAVVWRSKKAIPTSYLNYDVYDGDRDDRRYADKRVYGIPKDAGYIISLTAKGRIAKADQTGFVLD